MKRTISLLTLLASVVATAAAQTADKKTLTLKGAEAVIAAPAPEGLC